MAMPVADARSEVREAIEDPIGYRAHKPQWYAAQADNWETWKDRRSRWEDSFAPVPLLLERLYALRTCALIAHEIRSNTPDAIEWARRACYDWVSFLISEEASTTSFFL